MGNLFKPVRLEGVNKLKYLFLLAEAFMGRNKNGNHRVEYKKG